MVDSVADWWQARGSSSLTLPAAFIGDCFAGETDSLAENAQMLPGRMLVTVTPAGPENASAAADRNGSYNLEIMNH